jgi:hypothetical protein
LHKFSSSTSHVSAKILLAGAITNSEAWMQWKYYLRNVVQHYQVLLEGWPKKVPFENLSEASSSIADLEDIL